MKPSDAEQRAAPSTNPAQPPYTAPADRNVQSPPRKKKAVRKHHVHSSCHCRGTAAATEGLVKRPSR
ncbi:hypothetical protein C2845_PM13G08470 [Panicum miliaceum]|uniref:Uncharacterized protein n=1 Tax=Panicum miliaceum TaxID=4540 RepID=A0A3L6RLU9_PANMI|nr:hypothetical protein C2845_PM13G08470 [Panicum miliaceum]